MSKHEEINPKISSSLWARHRGGGRNHQEANWSSRTDGGSGARGVVWREGRLLFKATTVNAVTPMTLREAKKRKEKKKEGKKDS